MLKIVMMFPKKIKLKNGNEVMKRRRVKAVIRFHTPNRNKEPEKFYHHLLMLYLPWHEEGELVGPDELFATKYYELSVKSLVEKNREIFEPNADALKSAFEEFNESPVRHVYSLDVMNDQENDDVLNEVGESVDTDENDELPSEELVMVPETCSTSSGVLCYNQPSAITDDSLRECVRCLNTKQRFAYNVVLQWCRNMVKNANCLKKEKIEPIHVFITGGAGSGKSHLIKTIYHTAVKTFNYTAMNPALPKVLLMAPTGVAAVNISGNTINTALAIPKDVGTNLSPLSDQKKTILRLTVLCKSNESEFRRISTKFAEIVRYFEGSEFSAIFRCTYCSHIIEISCRRAKFRMAFCSTDSEISHKISFKKAKFRAPFCLRERNFVHHFVWESEISWKPSALM